MVFKILHFRIIVLTVGMSLSFLYSNGQDQGDDFPPQDSTFNEEGSEDARYDFDVQLSESYDTLLCLTQVAENDSIYIPFTNLGNITLTQLTYTYDLGSQTVGPLQWTGSVETNETGYLSLDPFLNAGFGQITFTLFTESPNGVNDADPTNDTVEVTVTIGEIPQLPASLIHAQKCFNDTLEIGSNLPQSHSFYWHSNNDSARVQSVTEEGLYTVEALSFEGCTNEAQYFVEDYPAPDPNWIDRDTFCLNESPVMSVSNKFTSFQWQGSGIVLSDSAFSPVTSGIVSLQVTDTNNCTFTFDTAVHVSDQPGVTYPGKVEFCKGDFAQVNPAIAQGQLNFNYAWSDGNTSQARNIGSPGNYRITISDEYGCYKVDSLVVVENDLPEPKVAGPSSFCSGEEVVVASNKLFSNYRWNTGNRNRTQTVNSGGTYKLTVTDKNNCRNSTSFYIEEIKPRFSLGGDTVLCNGDALLIDLEGSGDEFNWNDGSQNSKRIISEFGVYSVSVVDSGCTFVDTFIVDDIDKPQVDFSFDVDNFTVYFRSSTTNADSIKWIFEPGQFSSKKYPDYTYSEIGTFPVELEASNICGKESIIRYVSVGSIGLMNHEIFDEFTLSPNPVASGDVLNIRLSGIEKSAVTLRVYNALGQLMLENKSSLDSHKTLVRLNLVGLAAGNYFITASSDEEPGKIETKQFVITK